MSDTLTFLTEDEFLALDHDPAWVYKHRWDEVADALRDGKNVLLRFTSRDERKRLHQGVKQMASWRGLIVEVRFGDSFLAIRPRVSAPFGPLTPLPSPHHTRRPTRRLRSIRVDRVDHRSP